MIKRRTIGLAAATVIGGLGVYGATAAFATTETPAPTPSTTQGDSGEGGTEAMIRHCTDQLPVGERTEARDQMEKIMSTMPADMTSMMPEGMEGMEGMEDMMSGADGMSMNSARSDESQGRSAW